MHSPITQLYLEVEAIYQTLIKSKRNRAAFQCIAQHVGYKYGYCVLKIESLGSKLNKNSYKQIGRTQTKEALRQLFKMDVFNVSRAHCRAPYRITLNEKGKILWAMVEADLSKSSLPDKHLKQGVGFDPFGDLSDDSDLEKPTAHGQKTDPYFEDFRPLNDQNPTLLLNKINRDEIRSNMGGERSPEGASATPPYKNIYNIPYLDFDKNKNSDKLHSEIDGLSIEKKKEVMMSLEQKKKNTGLTEFEALALNVLRSMVKPELMEAKILQEEEKARELSKQKIEATKNSLDYRDDIEMPPIEERKRQFAKFRESIADLGIFS